MSKRLEEIYQERENGLKIIIELIKEDKEKLEQQNKRYREALEFYAVSGQGIGEEKHGEVARKALEGESSE